MLKMNPLARNTDVSLFKFFFITRYEPRHEKSCLRRFATKDTNWPVQLQRLARVLKLNLASICITVSMKRTAKVLIRLGICTFVFHIRQKRVFS